MNVSKRTGRSILFDNLLRLAALGTMTATAIIAPNGVQLLDKPIQKLLNELDRDARNRELTRALTYLKSQHLIHENYAHGITLTPKGQHRLKQVPYETLQISKPLKWDGQWRIIFYDIPEDKKTQRDAFTRKIRSIGFKMLQRSVFIYPHPCKEEVLCVADYFDIAPYVTYVETSYIDNDKPLKQHFKSII